MRMAVAFLVLGLLVIAACAPQQAETSESEFAEEAGNADAVKQTDQDLDASELNNLDEELDDLSW